MNNSITQAGPTKAPIPPAQLDPLETDYLCVNIKIDHYTIIDRMEKITPYVCLTCGWNLFKRLGKKGTFIRYKEGSTEELELYLRTEYDDNKIKQPVQYWRPLQPVEYKQLTAHMREHEKVGHLDKKGRYSDFIKKNYKTEIKKAKDLPQGWIVPERGQTENGAGGGSLALFDEDFNFAE